MQKILLLLLLLGFVFMQPSVAQIDTIDTYQVSTISTEVELNTEGDSAYTMTFEFRNDRDNPITNLPIQLPEYLSNVTAEVNNQPAALTVTHSDDNTLLEVTPIAVINPEDTASFKVTGDIRTTLQNIDESSYQYFFNYNSNLISSNINISIVLPLFAVVNRDGGENNVFPNNAKFDSNGQNTIVRWTGLSNDGDINTRLFLQFDVALTEGSSAPPASSIPQEDNSFNWIPLLSALIAVLMGMNVYFVYMRYYHQKKIPVDAIEGEEEVDDRKTKIIKSVKPVILNPQELEILKIIAEHDGGLQQSELVDIMNYSSARISQFLSKFEEMDLITKHKMGRQNYISLNMDIDLSSLQDQ